MALSVVGSSAVQTPAGHVLIGTSSVQTRTPFLVVHILVDVGAHHVRDPEGCIGS